MKKDFISLIRKNQTFFAYKPHLVENPDFVFVAATGLAEHAMRYYRLSEFLKNHNVQLYCIDHPGQGSFTKDLGVWKEDGFNTCVDNLNTLVQHAKKDNPEKKVILFGHSMGSFISLAYIQKYSDVDACILSGTNDKQAYLLLKVAIGLAKMQKFFVGRDKKSKLLNTLSFGQFNKQFAPNRTEFDWLSTDDEEVDLYVKDPLCGFVPTVGLFHDLFQAFGHIYRPENIEKIPKDLPIYLFAGSKDPVGANGKGPTSLSERLKGAGIKNVSLKIYENYRHECLNEKGNDIVMKDIYNFCTTIL